jgi:hypothetical protein
MNEVPKGFERSQNNWSYYKWNSYRRIKIYYALELKYIIILIGFA